MSTEEKSATPAVPEFSWTQRRINDSKAKYDALSDNDKVTPEFIRELERKLLSQGSGHPLWSEPIHGMTEGGFKINRLTVTISLIHAI